MAVQTEREPQTVGPPAAPLKKLGGLRIEMDVRRVAAMVVQTLEKHDVAVTVQREIMDALGREQGAPQ